MRSSDNIELLFKNLGDDWQNISPEEFATRVEQLHGIQIEFVEMPLPTGYFGACMVVVEEAEVPIAFVFYAPNMPAAQQAHVKTHEVAHIALRHNTIVATIDQLEQIQREPSLLFNSQWAIACRATTPRRNQSQREAEEEEAELLTRLVYEKHFAARQKEHLKHGSSQADADEALRRMGIA